MKEYFFHYDFSVFLNNIVTLVSKEKFELKATVCTIYDTDNKEVGFLNYEWVTSTINNDYKSHVGSGIIFFNENSINIKIGSVSKNNSIPPLIEQFTSELNGSNVFIIREFNEKTKIINLKIQIFN